MQKETVRRIHDLLVLQKVITANNRNLIYHSLTKQHAAFFLAWRTLHNYANSVFSCVGNAAFGIFFFQKIQSSLTCWKLLLAASKQSVSATTAELYIVVHVLQHCQSKSIYSKRRAQKCELQIEKAAAIWPIHSTRRVLKTCYIILSLLLPILSTNRVTSVLNAKQQWIHDALFYITYWERAGPHALLYVCMCLQLSNLINLTTLERAT